MKYKKIITKAYNEKYAIPHFNFDNLEMCRFILEACEEEQSPLFLSVSESAVKYIGGYNVVKSLVESLKDDLNITIPVILHLDHGSSKEECIKAIAADFDSVMLDLSAQSLDFNIQETKELVEFAQIKNTIVECEVGAIGSNGNENIKYASVLDCTKIVKETNTFMLAPAIGTVHGLYKGEQNINIPLLKEINESLRMPLVMHGASDLDDELVTKCIENGITKINVNTDFKIALVNKMKEYIEKNPNDYDYRNYFKYAKDHVKETIKHKIRLFKSNSKA